MECVHSIVTMPIIAQNCAKKSKQITIAKNIHGVCIMTGMDHWKREFLCHQDQRDLLFDVVFKNSRLIVIRQHEIGVPNEGWGTVVLEAHEKGGNTPTWFLNTKLPCLYLVFQII